MRKEELLSVSQAAKWLEISRSTLYALIRKYRRRGEAIPFTERVISGRRRLVADRQALSEWYEKISMNSTSTTLTEQATSSPLAQSAESTTAKELLRMEPPVTRGAQMLDELPTSYLETRITVMPRDPDTLVVCWDVHPETAKAYPNARWGLSVKGPNGAQVVEIQGGARNWYLHEPGITRSHEVFFGPLDAENRVIPLTRGEWRPYVPPSGAENPPTEWGQGVVSPQGITLRPERGNPVADTDSLHASRLDGEAPHSVAWNRSH